MVTLKERVVRMFADLGRDTLDLHTLFEAAGRAPEARAVVLETIDELVDDGVLESRGGDFYALTATGRLARAVT